MKILIFLAVAGLLLVPSVAASPEPPCSPDEELSCWWAWVEDNSPLPLCSQTWIPEVERICTDIIPPP